MGSNLLSLYQEKTPREWKIAFWTAFIGCLMIHIYKFTNFLPNHDSLYSLYSNLDATVSGRWFLPVAGLFSSYFDLPWINGLLSALYLGLTAVVITELFSINNPIIIGMSSVLLVASPCTTETFFYEFTADAFFLGLFLATLGSYLCIAGTKRNWKKMLVGCSCLCLSCGIYQAYISFAILLFLCHLVIRILNDELSARDGWIQIGKQILLYAVALAAYYGIWKLILLITKQSASSYQGIDSVGQVSLSTLINGAISSIVNLLRWFFGGNILKNPITLYSILHYLIVIALIGILITALVKSNSIRKPGKMILVLLCMVGSVPVISMWGFVSSSILYRPMMMHSVMILFILAVLLFDRWGKPCARTVFAALMAVTIFNYSLLANVAYVELDLTSKRSQATATEIMQTIHSYDNVTSIAFIGSRQDSLYVSSDSNGKMGYPLTNGLEKDLLYDHSHAYLYLTQYMGLSIPSSTNAEIQALTDNPDIQALPAWPSSACSTVVDGILVIKLANQPAR